MNFQSIGASIEPDDGYDEAADFLDPILSGEVFQGTWDPAEREWI